MSIKEDLLTFELANKLFTYHPDGSLLWKSPTNKTKKPGQKVGGRRKKDGRQQVMLRLQGKSYLFLVYRIIWLLHHGSWPLHTIEHINGDAIDDRIENLRDVIQAENNENKYTAQANNDLGLLGVCNHMDKFRATINKNGIQYHLGLFDTPEAAKITYDKRKSEIHIKKG